MDKPPEEEFETVSVGSVPTLEVRERVAVVPFYRRYFLPMLLGMLLVAVALGVLSLWSKQDEAFPTLPPGSYAGELRGVFADETQSVFWYVESSPQEPALFVAVLRRGWEPQSVRLVGESLSGEPRPLILTGEEGTIQLTGRPAASGQYRGKLIEHNRQVQGDWMLGPVSDAPPTLALQGNESGLRLWLTLRAELRGVEAKRAIAEQDLTRQRAEVERLTAYVTDDKLLRSQADTRFDQAKAELEQRSAKLRAAQAEVAALAKQFALSQRIAGAGKLVSLARDTTDREARWIRSMLRTSGNESAEELEARERAEKIIAVQAEIVEERRLLEEQRAATPPTDGAGSFDDLFRQGGSQ